MCTYKSSAGDDLDEEKTNQLLVFLLFYRMWKYLEIVVVIQPYLSENKLPKV
jgi:hypothetical protein